MSSNSFDLSLFLPWAKLIAFLVVLYLSYFIPKKVILKWLHLFFAKTKNKIDDLIVKNKLVENIVAIVPGMIAYYFFNLIPRFEFYGKKVSIVYVEIMLILLISKFLNFCNDFYNTLPISKNRPIKGYIQLLKIFIYIVGAIFVGAYILDRSPWGW